jgi:methionyl aminopeptidase
VHGILGRRKLREGDLVKLDFTIAKNGFMADAAITVSVGAISPQKLRLVSCAEHAFELALGVARPSVTKFVTFAESSNAKLTAAGFLLSETLGAMGVGRTIHEEPRVPNYSDPTARQILTEGLVITIEPIIAAGRGTTQLAADGWTIRTAN